MRGVPGDAGGQDRRRQIERNRNRPIPAFPAYGPARSARTEPTPMFQISIVNRSTTIAEVEMHRVVRAINRQIAEDFEPYWAFGGRLRVEGPIGDRVDREQLRELRGDAIIYVLDQRVTNDLLGFHQSNQSSIPYGFVHLDLCKELGDEWSVTLSHEALELIADPLCNLTVLGRAPTDNTHLVFHAFEMCDAVQSQSYHIDSVAVSNFVLPQYFTGIEEPGARNDFCGTSLQSFGVNPGGYLSYFDPSDNTTKPFFGDSDRAQQRYTAKRMVHTGRVFRRAASLSGGQRAARPWMIGAQALKANAAVPTLDDHIEHVVVLMLENRSFDHMLGALKHFNAEIDGIDRTHPGKNRDTTTNQDFEQKPNATDFIDNNAKMPHEFCDATYQISDGMAHFVDSFRAHNADSSPAGAGQVMSYFDENQLPVLHTLAKNFTVCDRWFSSLPGPTWPNRLFVHSGTSMGDVLMPEGVMSAVRLFFGRYTQRTLYDRLDDAQVSWKIYHGGTPQSIVLDSLKRRLLSHDFASMKQLIEDCAGPAQAFPSYAFIEPRYFDGLHGAENDQHAPAGVQAGEELIAQVYHAIRANEALWKSTLLIITYDEHGGFYDHVPPPAAMAPDDLTESFGFNRLGVRVPALLVSPWVPATVDHTIYDHTSILRYACEKWGLPYLCRRIEPSAGANVIGTFAHAMSCTQFRTDTPLKLPTDVALVPAAAVPASTRFDDSQAALVCFAELARLESTRMAAMTGEVVTSLRPDSALAPPEDLAGRAKRIEEWIFDPDGK